MNKCKKEYGREVAKRMPLYTFGSHPTYFELQDYQFYTDIKQDGRQARSWSSSIVFCGGYTPY